MKINQYEFLRNGKPFEPTREEIIQFAEHELAKKDKQLEIYKNLERYDVGELLNENIKLRQELNKIKQGKTLYAIEYNNQVVWDWENKENAIYLGLYETKINKHKIWWYYKKNFKMFQKVRFKDFKIIEYKQQAKESFNANKL